MHEQSLSSNIINNKIRQQMYQKHLKEIEKLHHREIKSLKKQLKVYHSITDLHRKNKTIALQYSHRQNDKEIQVRNQKIKKKIQAIRPVNAKKMKKGENTQKQDTINVHDKMNTDREGLHYVYRKRRQQSIERENQKLMKALTSVKSTVLPQIHKRSQSRNQAQNQSVQKSKLDIQNGKIVEIRNGRKDESKKGQNEGKEKQEK